MNKESPEIKIGRYCVHISIEDNATGETMLEEAFATDHKSVIKGTLREVSESLDK